MQAQQGDVRLFQTNDDGNINLLDNGLFDMDGGLETAAYLSMWGGNEEDDGREDNLLEWWGNIGETEVSNRYRSETQNLLASIPATSSNLRRIEDAGLRDLNWFLASGVASSVEVVTSIPALNKVKIKVNINAEGEEHEFTFVENWKGSV